MSLGTDRLCLCAHPEGEHAVTGECMIHRQDQGEECGCNRFDVSLSLDEIVLCDVCGWSGPRTERETNWCTFHRRTCCRVCWWKGLC